MPNETRKIFLVHSSIITFIFSWLISKSAIKVNKTKIISNAKMPILFFCILKIFPNSAFKIKKSHKELSIRAKCIGHFRTNK